MCWMQLFYFDLRHTYPSTDSIMLNPQDTNTQTDNNQNEIYYSASDFSFSDTGAEYKQMKTISDCMAAKDASTT